MDDKELIFQQYKLYAEQKENFISRSFKINRFYLILTIILLILVKLSVGIIFAYTIPLNTILAIIGMGATILWYTNMDSYNLLIKVKYAKVLEQIEKELPKQPYHDEYLAIKEYRDSKKKFLFADIQKVFAIVMFIMFFLSLIETAIPLFVK